MYFISLKFLAIIFSVSRKDGAGDAEANAPQGDVAATPGEEQPQVDVKLTEQAAEGAAEEQPAADEVPYHVSRRSFCYLHSTL